MFCYLPFSQSKRYVRVACLFLYQVLRSPTLVETQNKSWEEHKLPKENKNFTIYH